MSQLFYDETIQRPTRRFWLGLAGATALIATIGVGTQPYLFPRETVSLTGVEGLPSEDTPFTVSADSVETASPKTSASAEQLSPIRDDLRGFQVSIPTGWSLQRDGDVIAASGDTCGSPAVLFYPIRLLDRNVTVSDLLQDVFAATASELPSTADTLSLGSINEDRAQATSILSGTICAVTVTGAIQATVEADQALVKLHWYPLSEQTRWTNTMAKVLLSYRSLQAKAIPMIGTARKLSLPDGWTSNSSEQSIEVRSGTKTVKASTIGFPASETLDTAISSWLQLERDAGQALESVSVTGTRDVSVDDTSGRRWNSRIQELEYTQAGTTYRGILTASYTDALGNNAWILWRTATATEWESSSSVLALIEASAQLTAESGLLPAGTALVALPTTAVPSIQSGFKVSALRDALHAKAAGRWESRIATYRRLRSATGEEFFATLAAQNPTTETYSAFVGSQTVPLTPVSEEDNGN